MLFTAASITYGLSTVGYSNCCLTGQVTAILTFLTFAIEKCKLSNFKHVQKKPRFCSHRLKIQKVKLKVNKVLRKVFYHENFMKCHHEISLTIVDYCKNLPFLIKVSKSSKDLRKILSKCLEKQSNVGLILLTFIRALQNG